LARRIEEALARERAEVLRRRGVIEPPAGGEASSLDASSVGERGPVVGLEKAGGVAASDSSVPSAPPGGRKEPWEKAGVSRATWFRRRAARAARAATGGTP
jgi:hypothetical protein